MLRRFPKIGVSVVFTIGSIVFPVPLAFLCHLWSCSQPPFCVWVLCSLDQVKDSFSSSISTAKSFDDGFSHNMWNPLLELLFHEQVSGIFESFVVVIDLANIALSCHFALGLLCNKEGAYDSA